MTTPTTEAFEAPEGRDLAHEADMERLRREQLRADIGPEEAEEYRSELEARMKWREGADLDGFPEDYCDDEDDPVCDRCHGDGMDPWNDYLLECPECNGRSPL